ncbi:helix-turn-helix domain-containing protein [Microbacterium sp. NPDC078428]|uniref:helix-turn-helix domain-containing protein n=1 Tax=Microbacterium sp. NPDC078428 TaxID=3364190 RepID=UPI0037CA5CB9
MPRACRAASSSRSSPNRCAYRAELGISAADLAARTGLSKGMISRIESATTSCSLTTLQRLAEGLPVPVTRSMTLRRRLGGANPHRHR